MLIQTHLQNWTKGLIHDIHTQLNVFILQIFIVNLILQGTVGVLMRLVIAV